MKIFITILTALILLMSTGLEADAKGARSSARAHTSTHTARTHMTHVSTHASKSLYSKNHAISTNHWIAYWILAGGNRTVHAQLEALKRYMDSPAYTVTVRHNGMDRVVVVTSEQYKAIQKGQKLRVVQGKVKIIK